MGKINSKQKGNKAERDVAKKLSDWAGQKFIRTPMSGAIHNLKDKRVVSDIVAPMSIKWPFSVEIKNVEYEWDFSTILNGTSTLWKHWQQAQEDGARENTVPILIFTKNYRNTFLALESGTFEELLMVSQPESQFMTHNGFDFHELDHLRIISKIHGELILMSLELFLSTFSLETVEKFYEKILV